MQLQKKSRKLYPVFLICELVMGFIRKYLSADGLIKTIQATLAREKFKVSKNLEYSW